MFYEVTKLRRDEQRLHPKDWPAPEFGYITMATWRPGQTTLSRTARVATLFAQAGMLQRSVMVLIEPRITHLPIDGQVWTGSELQSTDQGIREIEQAWLVRPRARDSQPLPPFDVARWNAMRRAARDVPGPDVGKGWLKPGRRHDSRH